MTLTGLLVEKSTSASIALIGTLVPGKTKRLSNSYPISTSLISRSDQNAIVWEGDEAGQNKYITYGELLREVCKIANVLKSKGVRKGDVVTICMPMIPE